MRPNPSPERVRAYIEVTFSESRLSSLKRQQTPFTALLQIAVQISFSSEKTASKLDSLERLPSRFIRCRAVLGNRTDNVLITNKPANADLALALLGIDSDR